jgi:ribosome modulation factor
METKQHTLGYNAYFDGLSLEDNPYTEDSYEYDEWENGWEKADSDADDEI